MNRTGKTGWRLTLAAAFFLLLAGWANAQVAVYIKGNAEPKRGDTLRYVNSTKSYVLIVEGVQLSIPFDRVQRVEIPKPAAMADAEKLLAAGQTAAAIPLLEGVASDYAVLQWGVVAQAALAEAYAKTGNPVKALATYSELFKNVEAGDIPVQIRVKYWKAMFAAQRFEALTTLLTSAVEAGSQAEAAHAQLLLGDVRRAQNKTADALLDYLRAALLFDEVIEVQPEALFKAAETMDVLRDPRGAELRKKLVQKFPGSEYGRKAAAPM